ncbi:CAMP-dependent protein kinase regulatory subunit, putative [Plasmodium gallinaceum]|uniref:cAMP-dependent protein kinase regulatory subunit, putative n=1 Tax=Plasmodium gallinaceum TaxID=5849 RepID=A0A1J1GQG6_PLAGA|nr:CAMP-dependent protein kinase regulatory subunit, putative [Plasmodium gallinaceum]CRG93535.1 CAMP-dependent protein kinase regulatory subunit, putative [Plasmodium gallinaceum]
MGNVCTWRQGKGKSADENLSIKKENGIQNDLEKNDKNVKNENKPMISENKRNINEEKDITLKESSIDKRENENDPKESERIDENVENKECSKLNKQVVITLNKNQIINEEYSSDGDETEYHSEMDKNEIEKKESDIANIEGRKNKRLSVSAEAYGEWNKKKENFVAKIYEKDEEEKLKIREALNESFLFNHLNEKEFETIVDAFFDKNVNEGMNIINEGDDGDLLYVIDEGEVEIYKNKGDKKEILTVLKSKDVFGELALLYNSKRAATATALTNCHLWALDRESFTYIIKDNVAKKRQMYEDILKQVTILQDMDPYERSKVADCLKSKNYTDEEIIIKEGEEGDTFYMLIDGNAIALKNDKIIKTYKKGDYFGELALLKNQPRAATVKCQKFCQVVYLDRKSFKRLLGPIEEILYRNVENYKDVLKQLGLDTTCIEGN